MKVPNYLESHSKISNLMIAELFYSHILNINRGSLHIVRMFRHRVVHPCVPEKFSGLLRNLMGPRRDIDPRGVAGFFFILQYFVRSVYYIHVYMQVTSIIIMLLLMSHFR